MYKLYFVRKDKPKIMKFDGRYNTHQRLKERMAEVRSKGYISYDWYMAYEKD